MKAMQATIFILGVLLSGVGHAQQTVSAEAAPTVLSVNHQDDTPAQQRIASAEHQLKADPKRVQAYNELAIAYLQRARETADAAYLHDADSALVQGLKLDAEDFQLQRTQVALMLARHGYVHARERATVLNKRTPDDVMTYGYLAEAEIALGQYPEAETNAQWMLNMRPNNIPGLMIGAKLRTLYGDAHGAIEFLSLAYSETSPTEVEELAWIENQIASIQIESGQIDVGEQTLAQADQLFPHYARTMENLARVRMAQHRVNDAVTLLRAASKIDNDPGVLYELAHALEASGDSMNARAALAAFEKQASNPGDATDEARLDLIRMYAASPSTAAHALTLAQQEIAVRQDVWTLDAYAWALYANAQYLDAYAAVQKAIAVGIQSAQIFDHAGHIALKLNHSADAAKYFLLSLQTNPTSEYAADVRKSSGLSEAADNREVQAAPVAPVATSAVVTDASNTPSIGLGMGKIPHTFSPIPDALLAPHPTGTEHSIHSAQAAVARSPKDANAYASLGAAYFQHARETGDVSDYQLAEQSLLKSLDLVSADFSADAALGTMAEVCMGEHRFADAITYAQKALSLGTGDVSPFAIIGDAYADMGAYDKAAIAYGRLTPRDMTLSPRAAYARDSRLSYLKFISGDTAVAISLMNIAVAEGIEAQLPSENLAWLYYELGEFLTQTGDAASADADYLAALNIHPGDYRALAALGKLRANNGRYAEAILLYQKAIAVVPMPIFISELGDLYAKSGNQVEAQKQYQLVEYIGLLGHINQVLHNRDLALFYADHDIKLSEALDLARKELEVRRDVYTWDVLAWTLYKNGKFAEASEASDKALKYKTRDALLLFHAGMIAERMGQREQARSELKLALQINPHFNLLYADAAQQRLTILDTQVTALEGPVNHAR
jgi:tetratricopeptide (TPR) repeat protein